MFRRAAASGSLAHAYLFVGPAHVGKTTVAAWLAAAVLCSTRDTEDPCGACPSCTRVASGTHPDVLALSGSPIGVDAAREWVGALHRTSLLAGWKIGIVEEAAEQTVEAANACLKAIEEPPARTCVILTTANPRSVLPTIASRCAIIHLHRVAESDIAVALAQRGVDPSVAVELAAAADGCPGRAIAWAADAALRDAYTGRERGLIDALRGTVHERLRWVESVIRKLPEDRAAAKAELMEYVAICRLLAHAIAARAVGAPTTRGIADDLSAPTLAVLDLVGWMRVIVRAPAYLAGNVAPRLILESLVIGYPA